MAHEITIPIGVSRDNNTVNIVLDSERDSTVLIAGHGVGIDILLRTICTNAIINYSPDEVQAYLINLKSNFAFKPFYDYRLPNIKVFTDNCEQDLALSLLHELAMEYERRRDIMRIYGMRNIKDYSRIDNVSKIPEILVIIDDIQEIFRTLDYSVGNRCLSQLNKLVYGHCHAVGIHLIIAAPNFNEYHGMEQLISWSGTRVAVRGDEKGAASILNSSNAAVILQNQARGTAI